MFVNIFEIVCSHLSTFDTDYTQQIPTSDTLINPCIFQMKIYKQIILKKTI